MRASCLCLVALLVAPVADAAPAPDVSKKKLEALKMKLPGVLNDWTKENSSYWLSSYADAKVTCKPEIRILRRVSPNRAKAVILFAEYVNQERRQYEDVVLTVYLTYHDGCWTTETFEASSRRIDSKLLRPILAFLMVAIDEAAEK